MVEKRRIVAGCLFVDDVYTAGPWTLTLKREGETVSCVATLVVRGESHLRYHSAKYLQERLAVLACLEAAFGSQPCLNCYGQESEYVSCEVCQGAGEIQRKEPA